MLNTQTLLLTALVAFSASPALADTATPMPTKQTMAMLHDRNCTTKTATSYQLDGSVIDAVRGPVVHPVTETRTTCARATAKPPVAQPK
jgi:hypothetical protein